MLPRRRRGGTEREVEMEDGDTERNYYFFFPFPRRQHHIQQPHHHNYSSASAESPRGLEYKKTHRKQTFPHINTSATADRSKKKKSTISFTCRISSVTAEDSNHEDQTFTSSPEAANNSHTGFSLESFSLHCREKINPFGVL